VPNRFLPLVAAVLLTACQQQPNTPQQRTAGDAPSRWSVSPVEESRPLFSEHFPASEFAARRERVFDAIGTNAIAVLQGAPMPFGFVPFRQSNEFYYLTGVASPSAYLVLDGATREAILYLPHRNERREYGEGKVLSAEDAELVVREAGVSAVHPTDLLREHLQARRGVAEVWSPHDPAEIATSSRGMLKRTLEDLDADPMDDRAPRHERFLALLQEDLAIDAVVDLTPVLDRLRMVKSEREIALITTSARLHGLSILEAMRATRPGITEADLEAIDRYVMWRHGVKFDAYYALVHVGSNAHFNHYHGGGRVGQDGDMVLYDYAGDYQYYVSDMGRMWPVNGRFNPVQRELYSFYLAFYESILYKIRPGVTHQQVKQEALPEIEALLASYPWSQERFRTAAETFVQKFREEAADPFTQLGHSVGMAAHDPFPSEDQPIQPGTVMIIEPQFRVEDERIYVRLEDMLVITEDGADIITDFVPRDIARIERLVGQGGMLQDYPKLLDVNGQFLPPALQLLRTIGPR
jgi:Xaa-Pro aminopeptidase